MQTTLKWNVLMVWQDEKAAWFGRSSKVPFERYIILARGCHNSRASLARSVPTVCEEGAVVLDVVTFSI